METVNAVPVFLYLACLVGLALTLFVIARICTPRQFVGAVQKMPYESGMDPIHDTHRRFDVRFHLIAIAFLVFDVEVLFLYPWAVAAKKSELASVSTAGDNTKVSAAVPEYVAPAPAMRGPPKDLSEAVFNGFASDRNIVFAGVMVFFVLLGLGFIYDLRKGVFQWR
jgi:NADH-quinone oxidoreductase subunit A